MSNGILYIVTGPSGAGKTSLIKEILKKRSDISFSVTYTTRPQRKNEVEGIDHFFVNVEKFMKLKNRGELLEWAEVHNNYYGTSKSYIDKLLAEGNDILMDLDIQGTFQVLNIYKNAVSIFVLPTSYAELKQRLVSRATEKDHDIKIRLEDAKNEIKNFHKFKYIIINDNFKKASDQLNCIISAEKLIVERNIEIIKTKFKEVFE
jgi:guanylate kinase